MQTNTPVSSQRTRQSRLRRVAYIHDSPLYGGLERYILLLLKYMGEAGYEPAVVIAGNSYPSSPKRFVDEVKSMGIPFFAPDDPGHVRGLSFARDVLALRRIFAAGKFDVVHTHSVKKDGARRATLAARLAGVKAVLRTEHVPPSVNFVPGSRMTLRFFDALTDYIIADSDSNRDEQISLLGRAPEKVLRSYCGIELDRYNPNHNVSEAKERLGLDPNVPSVGIIARLSNQKGHVYLIDAAAAVLKDYGPVNFLLVGDGPLEDQLRQQSAQLGITEFVHFLGFQNDSIPYMEAMDIVTLPSIYEGFSLAMLEYLAMGKPSVFSDHPSFKEAVGESETALIVEMANAGALAEAILRLLRDKDFARRLGQAGLHRVQTQFGIDRLVRDMARLYDGILDGKAEPRPEREP